MHISVLWGDFIPCSHYVVWLLWENSACFWRTCTIPSCCLNSWDAGKAATTYRMYSRTSLGSRVKPDVHIPRNNIWDDWIDWVGGQVEDSPREMLMKNWQPHERFCCREFLVIAPWCRIESLPLHLRAKRYPNWIYWAGRTAGMRRSLCLWTLMSIRESGLNLCEFILWIYGSKPTLLYFLQMPSEVCSASELRFPSKRQNSLLSSYPQFFTFS